MNLIMAGIDYKTAPLSIREKFSLPKEKVQTVLKGIKPLSGVLGCVLLSTCNRTELYLSLEDGIEYSPVELICEELGFRLEDYENYFKQRQNSDVVSHILSVTSGLLSQLKGDDQILTQTHSAITTAREVCAGDAMLETLFRIAVASGKRIKTEVPVYAVERSVARQAVQTLLQNADDLVGKKALVIGNGEMGRLSARLLVEAGCDVTITLRSYHRGETVIPDGCATIPYDARYSFIESCDILLSATASHHHTVTMDKLSGLKHLPAYIIDLAVPRDVEPQVDKLHGVKCWNVDTLFTTLDEEDSEKYDKINAIMEKYSGDFYRWLSYRSLKQVKQVGKG